MIRRHLWISGRVQGVGFRQSALQEAKLGGGALTGWVRNLPDGRVEAVFQGEESQVLSMVAWCRRGPLAARVMGLEVVEEDADPELQSLEVRR